MKLLLVFSGTIALVLGIMGVFLPLLPSTPLFLLAAVCYARSSERFYQMLMANRFLGPRIRNYRDRHGMLLGEKIFTIALLWLSITGTCVFFVSALWLRVILLSVAAGVTVHVLMLETLSRGRGQL